MKNENQQQQTKATTTLPLIRANVAGIDIGARQMHVCGLADAARMRQVRRYSTTPPSPSGLPTLI
jgi:hypothetical protein